MSEWQSPTSESPEDPIAEVYEYAFKRVTRKLHETRIRKRLFTGAMATALGICLYGTVADQHDTLNDIGETVGAVLTITSAELAAGSHVRARRYAAHAIMLQQAYLSEQDPGETAPDWTSIQVSRLSPEQLPLGYVECSPDAYRSNGPERTDLWQTTAYRTEAGPVYAFTPPDLDQNLLIPLT